MELLTPEYLLGKISRYCEITEAASGQTFYNQRQPCRSHGDWVKGV